MSSTEKTSVKIKLDDLFVGFEIENFDKTFHRFSLTHNFVQNEKFDYLISLPEFVNKFHLINYFFKRYNHLFSAKLDNELKKFLKEIPDHKDLIDSANIEKQILLKKIDGNGFIRKLKEFQIRNLQRLCALPHGANFSVPGAGKTTDAIGFYTFNRKKNISRLLVIGPLNSFPAWEEDIKACLGENNDITRLRGDPRELEILINSNNEFQIINYESLRNNQKLKIIQNFLMLNPETVLILDESHKAKAEKTSELLNEISLFPKSKLILTGTPMPQSSDDLRSQFTFLYPMHSINDGDEFLTAFQPFYVRTNDQDIKLKELNVIHREVEPYSGQLKFYNEYIDKKLDEGLKLEEIFKAKSMKKAYMKLLKFYTNPSLEIDFINEIDHEVAEEVRKEGDGAKVDAVIDRAVELIKDGEKVLIWSSFVANVEIISQRLSHFGAEYIHGGVDTEDSIDEDWEWEDLESREAKIRRFKESPDTKVLVANPAAAAESISLHKVCNNALYCDRTYNAAHFIQSQKRIHRLTDGDDIQKNIEIFSLNVRASIDFHVDMRLAEKCHEMSRFLNESELTIDWLNRSSDEYYQNFDDNLEEEYSKFRKSN